MERNSEKKTGRKNEKKRGKKKVTAKPFISKKQKTKEKGKVIEKGTDSKKLKPKSRQRLRDGVPQQTAKRGVRGRGRNLIKRSRGFAAPKKGGGGQRQKRKT